MIKKMASDSSSAVAGEALKSAAIVKRRSVMPAFVMCLAVSLGTLRMLGAAIQQPGAATDAGQSSGGSAITAKPEHVAVSGGPGSTENVSGTVERGASARAMLLQNRARWLLVMALIAIVYIAVYFSSTGTLRTTFPTEPTASPRPLHVGRNLLLGVAAFVCLDGVIFHTRLYVSILAPDSYAGRLAVITRAENQRSPSGLKEVLVLGDSRMAEGFSATVADKLGSAAGFKFVNLAEPASSINTWYYMLRQVDPEARRYWAIVVPYGIGYEPNTADPLRISMAATLLRYGDCFDFASGFQRWSGRFRAFTACILRGSAYQSDVADLLEHPIARIRSVQQEPTRLHSRAVYKGRDYDLVGTSYDPKTGQVTFPPQLTETQRQAIRKSLVQPSESEVQYFLKLQRDCIPRIVNRYSNSSTAIVLTPVPRGPFRDLTGFSMAYQIVFPGVTAQRPLFSVPAQTFDFLEKPDYYFDAYHLNAKGRQRFTETLVAELVGRLRSADSHTWSDSNSQIAATRPLESIRDSDAGNSSGENHACPVR